MFVFLYPTGNIACAAAAQRYRRCLTDSTTFDARTLDELVHAVRHTTSDPWITQVHERYLDPAPIKALL